MLKETELQTFMEDRTERNPSTAHNSKFRCPHADSTHCHRLVWKVFYVSSSSTVSPSSCQYQPAQQTQKPTTGTTNWSRDTVFWCGRLGSAAFCLVTSLLTLWMLACWQCLQWSRSSWRPKKGSLPSIALRSQVSCELLFLTLTCLVCCGGKTYEWFDFWLFSSSESAWGEGKHMQRCSDWGRRWAPWVLYI